MLKNIKLENFSSHLNSKFLVRLVPEGALELGLFEATDLGSTPGHEQFAIVFRGPLNQALPQATYSFEHQEIGAFELFIVPIKRDPDRIYYEAIFNRLL